MKRLLITLMFLCPAAQSGQMSRTMPGLVGLWHFEEMTGTVVNDALAVYNGTTSAAWVSGKIGGAVQASGSNGTTIPYNAAFAPANITVGAWIKSTNYSSTSAPCSRVIGRPSAFTQTSPYQVWGLDIYCNGTGSIQPIFQYSFSSGSYIYASGTKYLKALNWTFLVGTYDGAAARIYENGVLTGTATGAGSVYPATTSLFFALEPTNSGSNFKGLIDEAFIFNRALSAAEIKNIYLLSMPAHVIYER